MRQAQYGARGGPPARQMQPMPGMAHAPQHAAQMMRQPQQPGMQHPAHAARQGYGRPPPPPHFNGPGGRGLAPAQQPDDFLSRLNRAESRDSQRSLPTPKPAADAPIDETNWEQRSKNIARLHIQNEMAELSYKEKMGMLPGQSKPPAAPPQAPQARQPPQPGFAAPARGGVPVQARGAPMRGPPQPTGQPRGGIGRQPPPQQPPPGHVQCMQGYDPWDDRVPEGLRAGGQVMNAKQAHQARRGQGSSIVFG